MTGFGGGWLGKLWDDTGLSDLVASAQEAGKEDSHDDVDNVQSTPSAAGDARPSGAAQENVILNANSNLGSHLGDQHSDRSDKDMSGDFCEVFLYQITALKTSANLTSSPLTYLSIHHLF